MVDSLVLSGITVNEQFLSILPLSNPSKKVILSNVPPFIPDRMLEGILSRYGKIVGPLRMIPLGVKIPELKHIMSFRRQTFMIMKAEFEMLDVSVKLTIAGKDYMIFISNALMKCFGCGKHGHVKQNCQSGKTNIGGGAEASVPSPDVAAPDPDVQKSPSETANPSQTEGGEASDSQNEPPTPAQCPMGTESAKAGVPNVVNHSQQNERESPGSSEPDPGGAACAASGETEVSTESQTQHSDMLLNEGDLVAEQNDDQSVLSVEFSDYESDIGDTDLSQGSRPTAREGDANEAYYSVAQLNDFLDKTFNRRNVNIERWFPNRKRFLESCAMAFQKASLDELNAKKRYRLKKIMSAVNIKVKSRPADKRKRR